MNRVSLVAVTVSVFWVGLLACDRTQVMPISEPSAIATPEETAALDAVERFIQTFNSRDPALWAATLRYPHVRPSPRSAQRVTESAQEYIQGVDFERTVATGWERSEYDSKEVVQIGPGKAHVAGQYTRYRADGSEIWSNQVTYVVTSNDAGWGIQARFAAGFVIEDEAERQRSEEAALRAVDDFLRAFNSRDAETWAATLNYPHVRLAGGDVRVWESAEEYAAGFDFELFRETYNWERSEWTSKRAVQVSSDGVNVALEATRYDPDGNRLHSFPTLYLVTLQDGHWGVRARSSFASSGNAD